jgi:hypothetical protein
MVVVVKRTLGVESTSANPMSQVHDVAPDAHRPRQDVASSATSMLTALLWQVIVRVRTEALEGKRAAYGAHIVAAPGRPAVSEDLLNS